MSNKAGGVLLSALKSFVVELPTPVGISYLWNFGSMLAFCLGMQILTGLFLAMHYSAHVDLAFYSVIHLGRDVNYGWLIRSLHANGASLLFICLYLHLGRGLYYFSYTNVLVWLSGVIIFLAVMMVSFLGYVLPWGQMSFWGATVITNLLSAVPDLGVWLVEWLWGGYSVDNPTLTRFFALHFVLPFVIVLLVLTHLVFLHESGSKTSLGFCSSAAKVEFHPYFSSKDVLGLVSLLFVFGFVCIFFPQVLGDSENFMAANPLVTPEHIQPEWYFLFAYAILRSIPSSLGGVVALVLSVLVFFIFSLGVAHKSSGSWSFLWRLSFWCLVVCFLLLTWIGMRAVENPYIVAGQIFTAAYFLLVLLMWWIYSRA